MFGFPLSEVLTVAGTAVGFSGLGGAAGFFVYHRHAAYFQKWFVLKAQFESQVKAAEVQFKKAEAALKTEVKVAAMTQAATPSTPTVPPAA